MMRSGKWATPEQGARLANSNLCISRIRSAARTQEFAIRLALGVSRGRVVRQLITESVLLSLAGGALGLVIAKFGLSAVVETVPRLPRIENIKVNASVLLFEG